MPYVLDSKDMSSGSAKLFLIGSGPHFAGPPQGYKHIFPAQMSTAGCRLHSRGSQSRGGQLPAIAAYCVSVWVSGSLALSSASFLSGPGSPPPHRGD